MEKFLTVTELAEQLRMSAGTLANWRSRGVGPAFRKMGGRIVYPVPMLREWQERNTYQRTADYRN